MAEQLVSTRELREQIRDWRRGRVDTRWMDAFMDAYIAVFAIIMLGSMAVSAVIGMGEGVRAGCSTTQCHTARGLLPLAASLAVLAGAGAVARLFGPVFSTPAESAWLLAAPTNRGELVRPRYVRLLAATVVVVAVLTAGVGGIAGAGWGALVLAAACALATLTVVGATAVSQTRDNGVSRALTWLLALAAWALLVVLASNRAPRLALPELDSGWMLAIVLAGLIGAVLLVLSLRSLPHLRRRSLSPGGRLAPSISGALATLDLALLYDVLMARRWMGIEAVRPVRGGPYGPLALAYRGGIRVLRSPQAVIVLAGSVALPYAVAATDIGIAIALFSALACFLAGLGLLSGLRVFTRSASLARAFPYPDWQLRAMTLLAPGALIVLAGIATAPAMEGLTTNAWSLGLACGAAGLASAVRWVTGRPPDYNRPLVSTPAGGVPTNLYGSVLRGFDILVLTVAPMLLWHGGNGVEISLALSALTITVLISRK